MAGWESLQWFGFAIKWWEPERRVVTLYNNADEVPVSLQLEATVGEQWSATKPMPIRIEKSLEIPGHLNYTWCDEEGKVLHVSAVPLGEWSGFVATETLSARFYTGHEVCEDGDWLFDYATAQMATWFRGERVPAGALVSMNSSQIGVRISNELHDAKSGTQPNVKRGPREKRHTVEIQPYVLYENLTEVDGPHGHIRK